MRAVLVVVLGLAWLEGVGAALACDYPAPDAFVIRGGEHDTQPPAAPPRVEVQRIKRGREPKQDGCQQEETSCDDVAYVLLEIGATAAEPSAELGYVLEVKGKSPADLERYQRGPLSLSYEPGQLRLHWTDGEGHASYDFDIYVWSVDRAGNMSETPTQVHVETSGSDGCAASTSSHGGGWLLLLLGLSVLRRRREQRVEN